MLNSKRRVAFLAYHGHANLATWFHSPLKMWVRNGYIVDVIVPAGEIYSRFPFYDVNGDVFFIGNPAKGSKLNVFYYILKSIAISHRCDYMCLIGFDQIGIIAAGIISHLLGIPYLYQSLELRLSNELKSMPERILKYFEVFFNRRALLSIIQDDNRAKILSTDTGVPLEDVITVPNSPLGPSNRHKSDYLRDKFPIPKTAKIVLCAGSLARETMILEIAESMVSWPPEFVLVLNGWGRSAYLQEIRAIAGACKNRVFLSSDLLPVTQIDLLFRSADIGLAFYRKESMNTKYVGGAAGKVFYYFKHGIPIIASDLPGLREVVLNNKSGICINDINDIGQALRNIDSNYSFYSNNSLASFDGYEFSRYYQTVINTLESRLQKKYGYKRPKY